VVEVIIASGIASDINIGIAKYMKCTGPSFMGNLAVKKQDCRHKKVIGICRQSWRRFIRGAMKKIFIAPVAEIARE